MPEKEITLQKASIEDVDTFIALERSVAHLKTYSGIVEKQEALDEIKNNECFFIQRERVIVGSIEYRMKSSEHAYVSGLVIHPDFQGQGIARKAVNIILEKLNGVKRIDLVTHPENIKAIKLYLSLGFIIESQKENYFGDGEPRIVLALAK